MEVFHEETVIPSDEARAQRGYKRIRVLSWAVLAMAISFTLLLFSMLYVPVAEGVDMKNVLLFNILPVFVLMVGSYVLYVVFRRKKHSYIVDYDYTYVSGELRIAKVLNGIRRRPVAKITSTDITIIARVNSDKFPRYSSMPGIKKIMATPNAEVEDADIYFAFYTVGGQRSLLIFEPSAAMISAMKRYSGRSIEWA